ncbi:FAD-dependent monooxygenase [Antarcticimicrobium luteum]|uniref:2-polyprenyl-6-methoxyphenol hydroxylase n=1 Tax=Antarcticimicrobium luteum TaxID=2547397 RepID=A0A4R5V1S0_9RHOB|nr:FAD-dependent monooxygenase [Antarcticimicrobium luteum]TDK45674.1 2-polyprenyl-6-methoxyphenol hydroxylase [Antarcticimicrobium luteum]
MGDTKPVDVLIVGGGPVGLALAGDLGARGVSCALFEKTDGAIRQPKMDGISNRTMEFCRRWGVAEKAKTFPFPADHPNDMVYLTGFDGYELGRESFVRPSGGAELSGAEVSPEPRLRCPQNFFDLILRDFARSHGARVSLNYECEVTAVAQDGEGVSLTCRDNRSGESVERRGRYLVACDGGGSFVREAMGIGMTGLGFLNYSTNVLIRCSDLIARTHILPGYRFFFVGEEGVWATCSHINGQDIWRVQIFGGSEACKPAPEEVEAKIRRAFGAGIEFEILDILPWQRKELLADRYRAGRIFLAGDAAHITSPTGGFGMNTGIADAVDLSWKLTAVLQGWGGPALLDSYEAERRPVGFRAIREASGNLYRTLSVGEVPGLLAQTPEGARLRARVGRTYAATMLREWYKNGIDLGYVYRNSPICVAEEEAEPGPGRGARAEGDPTFLREWQRLVVHEANGTPLKLDWRELPVAEVMLFSQSAEPGARAPHLWLGDGRSTLDHLGGGFVLFVLGPGGTGTAAFERAAAERRIPLDIVRIVEPAVCELYRRKLVLIRPDGHVAWRGDDCGGADGAQALRILERATGA